MDDLFPLSVPWKVIGASDDMLDPSFGNRAFPIAWRSSLAFSVYEPELDEAHQARLCGQKIAFVKVSCSLTGYQPRSGETGGTVVLDGTALEELTRLTGEYLGCYGALLNVAFFPPHGEETEDLSRLPRILDFSPKNRELIRSITEKGEMLTGSSRELKFDESRTTTQKNETTVGVEAGVEYAGAKAVGKVSHTWGATQEDKRGVNLGSDESRSRSEEYSTTMDQLYSLLTGYHTGTNRATAIMLARPGTLQATDRRTFAQGLRMLEGVQDFVFVVARPVDSDGLCIEAQLETGHFPEDVPLLPDEDGDETREFVFTVTHEAHGRTELVPPYHGEEIRIGDRPQDTFALPSDDGGDWVIDTSAPGTEFGLEPGADRSRIRTSGRAPTDGVLTHEGHRRLGTGRTDLPIRVTRVGDRTVQAVSTATMHARGGESGRAERYDTLVDKDFVIHARRPRAGRAASVADTARLLVTRRGLAVCYRIEENCPVVVALPGLPQIPGGTSPDWWEGHYPIPQSQEAVYTHLHGALTAAAADSARGKSKRTLAETDHFMRRVASRLPAAVAAMPLSETVELKKYGAAAARLDAATVRQFLALDERALVRRAKVCADDARALRAEVIKQLECILSGV